MRAVAWTLGCTVCLLVIAGLSALYVMNEARLARHAIDQSRNFQSTLYDIRDFFARNERAEISSLKKGDPGLSQTLDVAQTRFAHLLAMARGVGASDHGALLGEVEALSHAKFLNMREALTRAASGADAGIAVLRTDANRDLSTQISALIDQILDQEAAVLHGYQRDYGRQARFLAGAVSVATITAIIVAVLATAMIRGEFARLGTEKLAVERLNAELEGRVRDRTHELEIARARAEGEARRASREQERVEILLSDLNHRVGNNLAMVSALIGLQLSRIREPQARQALESARQRVATIAQAQRRLRLSEDLESTQLDEVFASVVSDASEALAVPARIKIESHFEPFIVDARDAVSLSVVLNELMTNAVKHAFPDDRAGSIRIVFQLRDGVPEMTVTDDGIGTAATAEAAGLGATIVERLSQQHGGEVERTANSPSGTIVRVRLPGLRTQRASGAPTGAVT